MSAHHSIFYFPHGGPSKNGLIALGKEDELVLNAGDMQVFENLQSWLDKKDWVFGFLSYDLKNKIEKLSSQNTDPLSLPLLHFVRPEIVATIDAVGCIKLLKGSGDQLHRVEAFFREKETTGTEAHAIHLKPRVSKSEYQRAVGHLQEHIRRGDIYEVNYCQEFFAAEKISDPFSTWKKLNDLTEAPFSAFMQMNDLFLMCASPERFLKKENQKLISQPIKGTIKRGKNAEEDKALMEELYQSKKERAENVMIVDLVRNDLSKSATRGSVKVEELFGVHSFKTVHHLISTISAEIKPGTTFTQIIRDTFPMGSMTGAPKIRAMQLIDEYECSSRGIYSGSIGYINPEGDFDFNVIIRSIVYNDAMPYISCSVGSAITSLSNPEKEYEECLLKAEALMRALG